MRKTISVFIVMVSLLIISGCNNDSSEEKNRSDGFSHRAPHHERDIPSQKERQEHRGMMMHNRIIKLNDSIGENELAIPQQVEREEEVTYTIRASKGKTEIFNGIETSTYGYNGAFLGPMMTFRKGEKVKIKLVNDLDEETTFHWHGLEVAGAADGGPHDALASGQSEIIEFDVIQEAATLWFHPHPLGKTAEQVYNGLAGLIYVEDENSDELDLPSNYGENDIPIIVQDKLFDENKQLNYRATRNPDGTTGDTLLINGTINPKLTVNKEKVRLRLLNGSNARNFTFKLNSGDEFVQIATDGGFLNEPVILKEVTLTPSERAEIIVDFANISEAKDLALIDDEGTILLPFDVQDEQGDVYEIAGTLNDFELTEEEKNLPVTHKVELFGHMNMVRINGKKFDPDRIDLYQKQGETEVWEIYNQPDMMGGMIHPFHVHGAQFKIVSRNGEAPSANERGWKDSISVAPDERVKIAIRFKEKGVYMFHCHILEHEDNGMMGQILVE